MSATKLLDKKLSAELLQYFDEKVKSTGIVLTKTDKVEVEALKKLEKFRKDLSGYLKKSLNGDVQIEGNGGLKSTIEKNVKNILTPVVVKRNNDKKKEALEKTIDDLIHEKPEKRIIDQKQKNKIVTEFLNKKWINATSKVEEFEIEKISEKDRKKLKEDITKELEEKSPWKKISEKQKKQIQDSNTRYIKDLITQEVDFLSGKETSRTIPEKKRQELLNKYLAKLKGYSINELHGLPSISEDAEDELQEDLKKELRTSSVSVNKDPVPPTTEMVPVGAMRLIFQPEYLLTLADGNTKKTDILTFDQKNVGHVKMKFDWQNNTISYRYKSSETERTLLERTSFLPYVFPLPAILGMLLIIPTLIVATPVAALVGPLSKGKYNPLQKMIDTTEAVICPRRTENAIVMKIVEKMLGQYPDCKHFHICGVGHSARFIADLRVAFKQCGIEITVHPTKKGYDEATRKSAEERRHTVGLKKGS